MNAYFDAMRRYFDFSGRSTRSQYWLYVLIFAVIMIIAAIIDASLGNLGTARRPAFVLAFVNLLHIIPGLAVNVRRLHDTNRSGWWILISFIPLIGTILILVWLCAPSTLGANRFGTNGAGNGTEARLDPSLRPQSASTGPDLDRLEKLAALKASGAIDVHEFARMKADLLGTSSKA